MNNLEDWERRVDEELYFLTQDGYGGMWVEMKKEDIKNIIRSLMASLQQKIEEIPETYSQLESNEYDAGLKDMKNKVLALFPKK